MYAPANQPCMLYEGNGIAIFKEYVLRILSAAIICAIVGGLVNTQTTIGRVVGLLCGVLMVITVISPVNNISFSGVSDFWNNLSAEAMRYTQDGVSVAEKQEADIIKTRSEAYILDKANQMGLQIAVEVELDSHNGNIPCSVTISGNVSPYAQMQLGTYMEDTLGIAKENQKWK